MEEEVAEFLAELLIIIVMTVIELQHKHIQYSPEYNPIAIIIGNNLLCDFAVEVSGFVLKGKK